MKFFVSFLGNENEVEVDPYLEACAQVLKSKANDKELKVGIVMEVKKDKLHKKTLIYNTYYVLMHVGMENKAELLRSKFLDMYNIDVKLEPIHNKIN